MKIKKGLGESLFGIVNCLLLILLAFICLFPFVNTWAVSLSDTNAIMAGKVVLLPVGFELSAYRAVFGDSTMTHSLFYTIVLTVLYVAVAMIMTILAAYLCRFMQRADTK